MMQSLDELVRAYKGSLDRKGRPSQRSKPIMGAIHVIIGAPDEKTSVFMAANQIADCKRCPVCGDPMKVLNTVKGWWNTCSKKCVVVDVTSYRATEFCNRNHIRGYVNSSIRLGLEYEGELVSLLLVSKSRFERGKHEITRFCSSLGVVIVGGLSRLIHHLKDRGVKHLITYADLRFGDGESYAKAGFTRLKDTHVGYGWVKNRTLYPRQAFQKHKLKGLFENYDESHTEDQIMFDNGYRKFYDCGNAKYQIIL